MCCAVLVRLRRGLVWLSQAPQRVEDGLRAASLGGANLLEVGIRILLTGVVREFGCTRCYDMKLLSSRYDGFVPPTFEQYTFQKTAQISRQFISWEY